MRKFIILCVLIVSTVLSAQSTWKADVAKSKVNFSISHLFFSKVMGGFTVFDITVTANDDFDDPKFMAGIETASINTNNSMRDKDLRNKDYFDVTTYPTMNFKSTSYKKTGDKTFVLGGNLTIKGITKNVEFEGKLDSITTDPRGKKLRAALEFSGVVDRKDFNVGNSIIPMGEEVDITINLEMVQQ